MIAGPKEIELKLKIMEEYDKDRAETIRNLMAASTSPPVLVEHGPFKGFVEIRLPLYSEVNDETD